MLPAAAYAPFRCLPCQRGQRFSLAAATLFDAAAAMFADMMRSIRYDFSLRCLMLPLLIRAADAMLLLLRLSMLCYDIFDATFSAAAMLICAAP